MPLFPLPTASDVISDVGLRPEQVGPLVTSDALLADVTEKIAEAGEEVESMLMNAANIYGWPFTDAALTTAFPGFDQPTRAAETVREATRATLAVKFLAMAYVYEQAGQLNPAYAKKSDEYRGRADDVLNSKRGLMVRVDFIAKRQGIPNPANTFSVQPCRVDGYSRLYNGDYTADPLGLLDAFWGVI